MKEVITPELAREWLEASASRHQRLNQAVVTRYARDMRDGEWACTVVSPIILTPDRDFVIDGMHRLAACAKSGVPLKTYLITMTEQAYRDLYRRWAPR
jgi:hypothetical protein